MKILAKEELTIRMSGRKPRQSRRAAKSSLASTRKTKADILEDTPSAVKKQRKRYEGATFDGGFNQDEIEDDRAQPVFTEPMNLHANVDNYVNVDKSLGTTEGDVVSGFAREPVEMSGHRVQRPENERASSPVKKFLQKKAFVQLNSSVLSEESRLHPAKDEKIMAILGSRANISSERASSETSATDGESCACPQSNLNVDLRRWHMDLTAKYQWKRVKMRTDLVPTQPWQTRASMRKRSFEPHCEVCNRPWFCHTASAQIGDIVCILCTSRKVIEALASKCA